MKRRRPGPKFFKLNTFDLNLFFPSTEFHPHFQNCFSLNLIVSVQVNVYSTLISLSVPLSPSIPLYPRYVCIHNNRSNSNTVFTCFSHLVILHAFQNLKYAYFKFHFIFILIYLSLSQKRKQARAELCQAQVFWIWIFFMGPKSF